MLKSILTAAAFVLVGSTASQAVVLFQDNFDGNTTGVNKTPVGWTVTAGAVDVVASYGGQGRQIDLDSNASAVAAVIQTNAVFTFAAGNAYKITFDYGRRLTGTELAVFGAGGFGGVAGVFGNTPVPTMLGTTFTFYATTSFTAPLFFSGLVGNSRGLLIDNVKLETVTPVPVPPAMLLLATGLFGIGALGQRRDR
jgi:hypothetical protein